MDKINTGYSLLDNVYGNVFATARIVMYKCHVLLPVKYLSRQMDQPNFYKLEIFRISRIFSSLQLKKEIERDTEDIVRGYKGVAGATWHPMA